MEPKHIKEMFDGVEDAWQEIIRRKLKLELIEAIEGVNKALAGSGKGVYALCPQPQFILNAFRQCPFNKLKVVIVGQDPYTSPQTAQGMAFSTFYDRAIPESLVTIYNSMINCGAIHEMPKCPDLTSWAAQGVLLINAALTTEERVSNKHAKVWKKYTDGILATLGGFARPLIFILLGEFAQKKASLIKGTQHKILRWGHPSDLNANNRTDNPKAFKYCNIWNECKDIDWSTVCAPRAPVAELHNPTSESIFPRRDNDANMSVKLRPVDFGDPLPVDSDPYLYIAVDGGAIKNGKPNCCASYAYYVTDGISVAECAGLVPADKCVPSNNRGELMAVAGGLHAAQSFKSDYARKIRIIIDSEYSKNAIETWYAKWVAEGKLADKKNLDLIEPIYKEIAAAKLRGVSIEFIHVNSHIPEPQNNESQEWFYWRINCIVDEKCTKMLK